MMEDVDKLANLIRKDYKRGAGYLAEVILAAGYAPPETVAHLRQELIHLSIEMSRAKR